MLRFLSRSLPKVSAQEFKSVKSELLIVLNSNKNSCKRYINKIESTSTSGELLNIVNKRFFNPIKKGDLSYPIFNILHEKGRTPPKVNWDSLAEACRRSEKMRIDSLTCYGKLVF